MDGRSTAITILLVLNCGCETNEERAAKMGRAFRTLNLPQQLENDRLQLSNDQLKVDIAKLEAKPSGPFLLRLQIDTVVAEGTKTAIRLAREIDHILALPATPANRDLRTKASDLDKRFNEISDACHSGAFSAKSVKDAHLACVELDNIHLPTDQ